MSKIPTITYHACWTCDEPIRPSTLDEWKWGYCTVCKKLVPTYERTEEVLLFKKPKAKENL